MGLADAFSAEDRVEVKFSDFYTLVENSAKANIMFNGIKCRVPHEYIEAMMTGKPTTGETVDTDSQ